MRKVVFLLVAIMLVTSVSAALEVVPGTISNGKVSHSFDKSYLQVFPETIETSNGTATVNLTITNTYSQPLYYYVDPYLNEELNQVQIKHEGATKTHEIKNWGGVKHYAAIQPVLVSPGTSQVVQITLTTNNLNQRSIKYNTRVWADTTPNWNCVVSETCVLDYAIDPQLVITSSGTAYNDLGSTGSFDFMTGQIFNITGSSSHWKINSVNITMLKIGSPTDSAILNITLADSSWVPQPSSANNIPNSSIAIDAANISTGATIYTYTYTNDVVILNSTPYTLLGYRSGAVDGSNYVRWQRNSATDTYTGGVAKKDGTSSSWPVQSYDYVISLDYEAYSPSSGSGTGLTSNITYTNPVLETAQTNYFVNVSWSLTGNISNVTAANLTYNNTNLLASIASVGANWTYFNVSGYRTPLVEVNNTNKSFYFTYYVNYNNSVNATNTTSTASQQVNWAFYPQPTSLDFTTNVTETSTQNLNFTGAADVLDQYANLTDVVTKNAWINYNGTAHLSSCVANCVGIGADPFGTQQASVTIPFGASSVSNTTVNVTAVVNVTFGGVTMQRNNSVRAEQTINQMILNDCTVTTGVPAINYTVFDEESLSPINADLTAVYQVWLSNPALNRSHTTIYTGNSTYQSCIYPTNETYQTRRSLTYSATGYITRTQTVEQFEISNTSQSISLLLLNSSSAVEVTMTVVDQDDDAVENAVIYLSVVNSTGGVNLVSQGTTDFQGQKQFSTVSSSQYIINITNNAGVLYNLTSLQPASVGPFQILTTSLTFRVLTASGSSIEPLIKIISMDHTLTFQNTTGVFTLGFNDVDSVTTQVCLNVYNISSTNQTILGSNCTSSSAANLTHYIGNSTGSFLARAIATSSQDAKDYLMDSLSYLRLLADTFGKEGTVWSAIIILTMSIIGMTVTGGNPAGAIVGAYIGLVVSAWGTLVIISYGVLVGIGVVGAILAVIMKT